MFAAKQVSASPSFCISSASALWNRIDDICAAHSGSSAMGLDAPRAEWSTPPVPGEDVRFTQTVSSQVVSLVIPRNCNMCGIPKITYGFYEHSPRCVSFKHDNDITYDFSQSMAPLTE
jgi:hypothetical protein